jgi:hypothetical protein
MRAGRSIVAAHRRKASTACTSPANEPSGVALIGTTDIPDRNLPAVETNLLSRGRRVLARVVDDLILC